MLARSAYQSSVHFKNRTSSENLYREGFPAAQQFFHTNLVTLIRILEVGPTQSSRTRVGSSQFCKRRRRARRAAAAVWFQVPSLDWDLQGGGDFDCLVSGEEKGVVGLVGLEPTISPLWAVRFNQLNYKPLRISTCNSFGKSGRKEEAFALSASSSSQEWTIG